MQAVKTENILALSLEKTAFGDRYVAFLGTSDRGNLGIFIGTTRHFHNVPTDPITTALGMTSENAVMVHGSLYFPGFLKLNRILGFRFERFIENGGN